MGTGEAISPLKELLKSRSEEWRPIVGHEGRYDISNDGRVRSLINTAGKSCAPHILKQQLSKKGYFRIPICVNRPDVKVRIKVLTVSVELLKAFVGNPPKDGDQAAHLNGKSTDNRIENLRWVSMLANASHRKITETNNPGFKNVKATLTKEKADEIVRLRETTDMTIVEIARQTKSTRGVVGRFLLRQSYSDYWSQRTNSDVSYAIDSDTGFAVPARETISKVETMFGLNLEKEMK